MVEAVAKQQNLLYQIQYDLIHERVPIVKLPSQNEARPRLTIYNGHVARERKVSEIRLLTARQSVFKTFLWLIYIIIIIYMGMHILLAIDYYNTLIYKRVLYKLPFSFICFSGHMATRFFNTEALALKVYCAREHKCSWHISGKINKKKTALAFRTSYLQVVWMLIAGFSICMQSELKENTNPC